MQKSEELLTIQSSLELGICLAVCIGAAVFGAFFSPGEWYAELNKPAWIPPDIVFPIVWSALYVIMGICAWLVWARRESKRIHLPLAVFVVQLVLNAAWSWLFFGLHLPGWALLEAIFLLIAVAATLILFWRTHRLAGILFIPYLLWVFIAVILNFAIWRMNPA